MNKLRQLFRKLVDDQRGAVLIITTVYLPVIVGFFSLAVDMSYVYRTQAMLQSTADAAALAAMDAQTLPTIDATLACTMAKLYATKNMNPTGTNYGNVLKQNTSNCSDVVIGTWACAVGTLCTQSSFVSDAAAPCGTTCNAIKVTTRTASANSNPLVLYFASMIGWSSIDVSATAIATYGNDPGALPWQVGLVQDVSASFQQEINNAKAADQALANCMLNAAAGSKLGISVFGETSVSYLSPTVVNGGTTTITNSINGINANGRSPMPQSGGTDIAAGINSAINQVCPGTTCSPPPTSFKPAIVLVTDGLPNMCNGQSCSVSTAQAAAQAAADAAAADGFDIYVLYYCNDGSGTCSSQTNLAAQAFLQGLVKGNGKFKASATASDMTSLMGQGVCKPALRIRLVF